MQLLSDSCSSLDFLLGVLLLFLTHVVGPSADLGSCRPEFCGNEAILIRQSVATVLQSASQRWNDNYFISGKLEKANVDSVMHFHRKNWLGNVECIVRKDAPCSFACKDIGGGSFHA